MAGTVGVSSGMGNLLLGRGLVLSQPSWQAGGDSTAPAPEGKAQGLGDRGQRGKGQGLPRSRDRTSNVELRTSRAEVDAGFSSFDVGRSTLDVRRWAFGVRRSTSLQGNKKLVDSGTHGQWGVRGTTIGHPAGERHGVLQVVALVPLALLCGYPLSASCRIILDAPSWFAPVCRRSRGCRGRGQPAHTGQGGDPATSWTHREKGRRRCSGPGWCTACLCDARRQVFQPESPLGKTA